MASRQIVYKCLIISPSDVLQARDELEKVISEWNASIGEHLGARVAPVRWETHATPEMGDRAQAILNKQLVDACDLGVAVFWSRLGTPTGGHESGSAEEIERLLSRNSRVLVYFSSAPIPQDVARGDEFHRLAEARKRYESQGLLGTFATVGELGRTFQRHLTSTISGLLLQDGPTAQPLPATGTATAPRPDIRLKVTRAFVFPGRATEAIETLSVSVQNHSPSDFYLSGVFIGLESGGALWMHRDYITGQHQQPRKIAPGDSHDVHFDPSEMVKAAKGVRLTHAIAKDKIGREFRSPDGVLEDQLARCGELEREQGGAA